MSFQVLTQLFIGCNETMTMKIQINKSQKANKFQLTKTLNFKNLL